MAKSVLVTLRDRIPVQPGPKLGKNRGRSGEKDRLSEYSRIYLWLFLKSCVRSAAGRDIHSGLRVVVVREATSFVSVGTGLLIEGYRRDCV